MAYTDPHDWATAEFVTAALLDTHLRDNVRWLGGGSSLAANEGRGTTLPVSPVDGQLFVYVADATNGVEWLLKYNASDAGSFKWHVVGGPPMRAAGSSTAITSTLTDLTGATITAPLAGDYDVVFDARLSAFATANGVYCGPKIGAAAFDDNNSVALPVPGGALVQTFFRSGRAQRFTGLAASDVVKLQARTDITGTGTVASSNLSVVPVRVG